MASGQIGAALRGIRRIFEGGAASDLTDSELIGRFVEGRDESAFAALVARHGPMVLATCRGVLRSPDDAEDAFQATFLVLARKAGSIWVGESLGSWLHRVARRVAVQASVDASRRRERERASGGREPRAPGPWADVIPMLHEEIDRLPDKYRSPIVLCDLEALTREEAAGRLGWPPGTVSGRLARGRKLLHDRLSRRGATAGAGVLASSMAAEASTSVPPSWAEAAVGAATGRAGVGSAAAALWSGRVVTMMWLARLKVAGTVAMAVGLLAAGTIPRAEKPAPRPAAGAPAAAPSPRPAPAAAVVSGPDEPPLVAIPVDRPLAPGDFEEDTIRGRVDDPEGRPFAGARLYWFGVEPPPARAPAPRATSDVDGKFRLTIKRPRPARTVTMADGRVATLMPTVDHSGLVAAADGFGLAFVELANIPEPTLRLAPDLPVAGRVLDLQGRPVAGATVRGLELKVPNRDRMLLERPGGLAGVGRVLSALLPDLSPWLDALANGGELNVKHRAHHNLLVTMPGYGRDDVFSGIYPPAVTDAEGRFRIAGIGRERALMAVIEGPTIESRQVWIATRAMPTLRVEGYSREVKKGMGPNAPEDAIVYGASFDHVAGPGRALEGVVRDLESKEPLAGVVIRSDRQTFLDIGHHGPRATSDEQGRYRLPGLPEGARVTVAAEPTGDLPYPPMSRPVEVGRGQGPAPMDFPMRRGVVVTGRVLDRATGRPASDRVQYFVFVDNPNGPKLPDRPASELINTDPEGRYRLVAYPGRGLITMLGHGFDRVRGFGAEAIVGERMNGMFATNPYLLSPQNVATIVAIDPPPGSPPIAVDLYMEQGASLTGTVQDPEGHPLPGAAISGQAEMSSTTLTGPEFTITGLVPKRPRKVVIRHDARRLIGVLNLKGAEDLGPRALRLEPWGSVSGRVVDDDGRPRRGAFILHARGDWPPHAAGHAESEPQKYRFGPDGRFRVEGLIPGVAYDLDIDHETPGPKGRLVGELIVKAGEDRDLGDLRSRPAP